MSVNAPARMYSNAKVLPISWESLQDDEMSQMKDRIKWQTCKESCQAATAVASNPFFLQPSGLH
jgi:hypothetical protein